MSVLMASEDSNWGFAIGAGMVVGGYIWSIIDANLSAKKINELSTKKINATKLNRYQQKEVSTSLNYIPNQGLMASYNVRFWTKGARIGLIALEPHEKYNKL